MPLLKKNCTACHNVSKAEGDLNLESAASILKGGSSGPSAVANKGAEALLLARTTATDDEMPPKDNKVGAKRFTPQELGLIKLWIDRGGSVAQPRPRSRLAAAPAGRAAHLRRHAHGRRPIRRLPSRKPNLHLPRADRTLRRQAHPALLKSGLYTKPGVADLDLIQSLAMSPDGKTLASGGFRTIKLWQRPRDVKEPALPAPLAAAPKTMKVSPDGTVAAFAIGNEIRLWNFATKKTAQSSPMPRARSTPSPSRPTAPSSPASPVIRSSASGPSPTASSPPLRKL